MSLQSNQRLLMSVVRSTYWILMAFVAANIGGCSDSAPQPSGSSAKSATNKGSDNRSPRDKDVADGSDNGKNSDGTHVSADGTKWIGNIPYDVWYDNPLEVVNSEGEVATRSPDDGVAVEPSGAAGDGESGPSDSTEEAAATTGDGTVDWTALLPEPVIEAEIKRIRNDLNNGLQSVSQYNAHYKEIQVDGATLAAIAAITPDHAASFTWKPNAKHVRSLGGQITANSTALGRKAFDATKEPFEKVVSVLSGNVPPDLEEVPETVPLSDAVSRGDVMKRMQISYDWMKKNVPAENVLTEENERIRHEAAILATMGTIIKDKSYFLTDEESYRRYAQSLIDACQEVVDAANDGQFDAYTGALDKIYKACNDCHVDWRGE